MSETLSGGCLCGAIRYRLTGPSLFVSQCCCKDCQKATGTGHTTIVGIHKDQLRLHGAPATFTNTGETGGKVTRHFCGRCAGRLYTSGDLPGDYIMVQAGSLDRQLTPTANAISKPTCASSANSAATAVPPTVNATHRWARSLPISRPLSAGPMIIATVQVIPWRAL